MSARESAHQASTGVPDLSGRPQQVAAGVRAAYDAVAQAYDTAIGGELEAKPLDRALLDAFVAMAGPGTIADLGCGPGHVTRYLAARRADVTGADMTGADVMGVDLSPRMVAIAREHAPDLAFVAGSMLRLPLAHSSCSGAIALYSIIHMTAAERATACAELARVIRPGGPLLLAFHIDSLDFAAGSVNHLTDWFGERVDLDGYFLAPEDVTRAVETAGFAIAATLVRQPVPDAEYPSRRCYLHARRL